MNLARSSGLMRKRAWAFIAMNATARPTKAQTANDRVTSDVILAKHRYHHRFVKSIVGVRQLYLY